MDAVLNERVESPNAWDACPSPATLLIGIALLLGLHLESNCMNLLCFDSKALEQGFARLLIATKAAEAGAIMMLLSTVDAKSHVAPS